MYIQIFFLLIVLNGIEIVVECVNSVLEIVLLIVLNGIEMRDR